jgi:hypothetical protein
MHQTANNKSEWPERTGSMRLSWAAEWGSASDRGVHADGWTVTIAAETARPRKSGQTWANGRMPSARTLPVLEQVNEVMRIAERCALAGVMRR